MALLVVTIQGYFILRLINILSNVPVVLDDEIRFNFVS